MSKKNPIVGAILGFFIFGIFYADTTKRGISAFIGLMLASFATAYFVGSVGSTIVAFVGAYLGYSWCKERNDAIDAGALEKK